MEWISVKDRLPKEDGAYIVNDSKVCFPAYIINDECSILSYDNNDDGDVFCYHYDDGLYMRYHKNYITHWMPLPEPPPMN